MIDSVKKWTVLNRDNIEATYHELHSMAEISWQEVNTTAYLCQALSALGFSYQTFPDQTGVVVVWEGEQSGPTIGLRADMDALWQLVGGVWKANHSCGHDAHMTMALHALRCLKDIGFVPAGRLKFIFQPAEEAGNGAKSLLDKGMIDDVDYLLGIHVRPFFEVPLGSASPAIYHGAITQLRGTIRGEQAHAARPNLGTNVIDALSLVIAAVNAVKVDPTVPMSVKVTKVRAGSDNLNIIPDEAEFGLDLRAQTNEGMEILIGRVRTAILAAATANGATIELDEAMRLNAAVPNPFMEQVVAEAISDTLGTVSPPPITPGGEDFHYYATARPKLAATMVGLGTGLKPGLHHPEMSFELSSLSDGIAILAVSVIKLFQR